ncbi:hypothetical protein DFH09DRAFT_1338534 [Mycena vulgaris]|nr:hypothetical protein DFH09DRAFT_1338534 [Mycena vulgaris]
MLNVPQLLCLGHAQDVAGVAHIEDMVQNPVHDIEVKHVVVAITTFSSTLNPQRAGEQPTACCFRAPALRAREVILWSDFELLLTSGLSGVSSTFELLVGRWLFAPEAGEDWSIEDDHDGAHRPAFSAPPFADLVPCRLETAMANYWIPGLSKDEIKKAPDFIRACLRFDYTERATAKELEKHPFLADAFKC